MSAGAGALKILPVMSWEVHRVGAQLLSAPTRKVRRGRCRTRRSDGVICAQCREGLTGLEWDLQGGEEIALSLPEYGLLVLPNSR